MKRLVVVAALVLLASCGGEPSGPAAVASVTVTPGTDTLTALGETQTFTATARDAGGNVITGRTVTWTSLTPGVASVNATSGVASAVANGSATIRATIDGMQGDAVVTVAQAVATVTVTPGTAGLTSIGATRQFTAVARDANSNSVADARFLWLSSDQSVATIDTTGLATAKKAGQTTVTAAAQGIPGYATLNVTQAAASLAFRVGPPASTVAGDIFSTAVQVEVRDSNGAVVPSAQAAITLTASSGILRGTTTVNAINGVASFSGLWIELAGAGLTLSATSSGVTAGTSPTFAIMHGPLARVAITGTPGSGAAGTVLTPSPEVTLYDRFSNVTTGLTTPVTLSVAQSLYGAGLTGTTDRIPVNGVATFPGVAVTKAGTLMRVGAEAAGIESPPSLPFTMLTTFTGVGLGPRHSCGLTASGTFCWGLGDGSKLGTGNAASDSVPNLVLSGTVFTQVSGGLFHTCALSATGHAYCWGDGTALPESLATPLAFTSLVAGYFHTCGLMAGGAAYCWGFNNSGQLGDSTTDTSNVPVAVYGGEKFRGLATGFSHTCAIGNSDWAYCWGSNLVGELGSPFNSQELIPTLASSFINYQSLTAGDYSTCGVTTGGAGADVRCWGAIAGGTTTMTFVDGIGGNVRVELGGGHACGIREDGRMVCWGANAVGALGDGSTTDRPLPTLVRGQP